MHRRTENERLAEPTCLSLMRGRQWGVDLPVGRVSFEAKMQTRACDMLER
jgi:hypothetical protein